LVGDATTVAAGAAPAVVVTPSGNRLHPGSSGQPAALQFVERGFYEIRPDGGAGDSTRIVAVNVDLEESDLTQLDTALFAAAAAPRPEAVEARHAGGAVAPAELERRQRTWW